MSMLLQWPPDVPPDAVSVQFVRSSGPGGQHVNKVATAVQIKLDLTRTRLSPPVIARLKRLAGQRLTAEHTIVISADRFRSQARNREDAERRLIELIARASRAPKHRIATRPSRAARQQRMDRKTRRGRTKQMRRSPTQD